MRNSISHLALMIGATLALSVGAAQAQFTNGDTYPGSTPNGIDLSQITIPGVNLQTAPRVLVTKSTDLPVPTSATGVLNADGTPVHQTYSQEITAGAAYTSGTAGTALANSVVVNANGGGLANPGVLSAAQLAGTDALPNGYVWAAASTLDPNNNSSLYRWQSATYNYAASINPTLASAAVPNLIAGMNNGYVLDSTGAPVAAAQYLPWLGSLTTAQRQALNVAAGQGLPAFNAELKTLGSTWQVVSGSASDTALVSGNYTYQRVSGSDSVTTNVKGGTVFSNSAGYLASGPGGTAIVNANGSSLATAEGFSVSDKKGNTTTIGASSLTVAGPNGSVTIADPSIIVTNGTAAGTTTINNGTVTVGTSVNAPKVNALQVNAIQVNADQVNAAGVGIGGAPAPTQGLAVQGGTTTDTLQVTKSATVKGPLTVNGPTQLNGGVSVASGQPVDFGGNVLNNVGTPLAPSDAANKGYVDIGLSHLNSTLSNKMEAATAAAMSLASPDRVGNQTGAFTVSEAVWGSHSATGLAIIQQIYNAGSYDISIGGALAIADTGDVGGRGTVQFGWGGSPVPLK